MYGVEMNRRFRLVCRSGWWWDTPRNVKSGVVGEDGGEGHRGFRCSPGPDTRQRIYFAKSARVEHGKACG